MEFLIDIIFNIIFEGSLEFGTDKTLPLWVRILLLTCFVTLYGVVIGGLLIAAIAILKDNDNRVVGIMLIVFDIFLLGSIVYAVIERYRKNNK